MAGVGIQSKPFAVGFRLQISQKYINRQRFGQDYKKHPELGAAEFTFKCTDPASGKGIYTFCMCPGGVVVNASHRYVCIYIYNSILLCVCLYMSLSVYHNPDNPDKSIWILLT